MINNQINPILEAAYLYYYATEVGLQTGDNQEDGVKQRLMSLIGDALVIANEAKFDVFNALTLMDNVSVLENLKVFYPFIQPPRSYSLPVWGWGWLFEFLPLQLADCEVGWYEQGRLYPCWEGCGCRNAMRTEHRYNKSITFADMYTRSKPLTISHCQS